MILFYFQNFAVTPIAIILFLVSSPPIMGKCVSRNPYSIKTTSTSTFMEISDFQLQALLGKGGFGKVWRARNKQTNQIYALKVMEKATIITKKSVHSVLLQRKILSHLMQEKAEFVVSIHGSFQDQGHLYILMDYIEGQSLRYHISNGMQLEQTHIKLLIYRMVKALASLYKLGVVHGDIKPQNILFDNTGKPFLIDFGTASYLQSDNSDYNAGTLGYMAPEVITSQRHTFAADYYAVGVIAFQLFFKKRPYESLNGREYLKEMARKPMSRQNFPELTTVSEQAADFISQLLQRKQRFRLGFDKGIHQLLNHSWLASLDLNPHILPDLTNLSPTRSRESSGSSVQGEQSQQITLKKKQVEQMLNRWHVQQLFSGFSFSPVKQSCAKSMEWEGRQMTLSKTVNV